MATRGTNTDTQRTVPPQVIEDLLSGDTCYTALSILEQRGEPMVVEDLATAVLAAKRDCPQSDISDDDREEMRDELFSEHIPKLLATEILAYNSMVGTVELARPEVLQSQQA